jgi:uncharacterized protein with HEPN domain
MTVTARDRDALVELLTQANLVVAHAAHPKARFAASPRDQTAVAERLHEMAGTAARLSAGFRKEHASVPWDELAEAGRIARGGVEADELLRLWRAVKKLAPKLYRELRPAVEDDPRLAFALSPAEPANKAAARRPRQARSRAKRG